MTNWPPVKKKQPIPDKRVTILGQHIRLIRPELPKKTRVYKDELPIIKYDKRPRTNEIGMAEFFSVCLNHEMVKGGE